MDETNDLEIRREGRPVTIAEVDAHCPEKIELIQGQLFWTEEDRVRMLALLLANVGIDKAVRLGDPALWRAAVAEL